MFRRVAPEGHKAFTWPPTRRAAEEAAPRARLPPQASPATRTATWAGGAFVLGLLLFVAGAWPCDGSMACGLQLKIYGVLAFVVGGLLLLAAAFESLSRAARDPPPRPPNA